MQSKNLKKLLSRAVPLGILAIGVVYLCVSPAGTKLAAIAQARQATASTSQTETVASPKCDHKGFLMIESFDLARNACDLMVASGKLRDSDSVMITASTSGDLYTVTFTVTSEREWGQTTIVKTESDKDSPDNALLKAFWDTDRALGNPVRKMP